MSYRWSGWKWGSPAWKYITDRQEPNQPLAWPTSHAYLRTYSTATLRNDLGKFKNIPSLNIHTSSEFLRFGMDF